jgi:putative DNA primase/helicase
VPIKEERDYLRKVLGYNLSGDISQQQFFIYFGFGRNGKSFLCDLMKLILSKKYAILDQSIFVKPKSISGGANPAVSIFRR